MGVGRLYDVKGNVIQTKGKEHIAVIKPQKAVINPWKMLEVVMADAEYDSYISELENRGKFLFKIFYEQPVIKLAQDSQNDGDLLYAISFISSCYSLCKKGLRKEMIYKEENYGSKVKGKINVKKNIRENTCRGRNDRFYCKFIDFSDDNIENRILKVILRKSKKTIEKKITVNNTIYKQYQYCMNALKHVRDVQIKSSDFSKASVSGLYMYYKPVLKQAKAIYGQKYLSYKAENGETVTGSVYTTPYIINMETLFEFYVRSVLRKSLPAVGCELVSYSEKICLEDGINNPNDAERGIHLMPYCIPDIIIRDKVTQETVSVMDVKYKNHDRSSRSDSLQLLSYVLLTGVKHCGFIFPDDNTQIKRFKNGGSDYLKIRTPLVDELKYFELLMGIDIEDSILKSIIS